MWKFVGVLTFLDPPRFDTKQTIEEAMEMGVDVKMITGDNVLIARGEVRIDDGRLSVEVTEKIFKRA